MNKAFVPPPDVKQASDIAISDYRRRLLIRHLDWRKKKGVDSGKYPLKISSPVSIFIINLFIYLFIHLQIFIDFSETLKLKINLSSSIRWHKSWLKR